MPFPLSLNPECQKAVPERADVKTVQALQHLIPKKATATSICPQLSFPLRSPTTAQICMTEECCAHKPEAGAQFLDIA